MCPGVARACANALQNVGLLLLWFNIAVCHRVLPEVGDDQAIDGTVFTLDLPIENVIEMLPPGMFHPTYHSVLSTNASETHKNH